MKNILIAVDLKPSDQHLIDQGTLIADKFGSSIWLVHIAAPDPDFVGYEVGPTYIRDSRAQELRQEHKQLNLLANQLKHKNLTADALLIQGPTVEMLEREVNSLKINLLIMGSHKHGFFYDTFVGHTSVKLIKNLSVPIMIVPLPINDE